MRKISIFILLFYIAFFACAQNKHITRIAMINPSPGSLKNALNLIEKGHLHADSIVIVGLLHKTQNATLEATRKFLETEKCSNVEIYVIKGDISLNELFVENACTKEFKDILDKTDALIRFGGDDIVPSIYGEETFLTTEIVHRGHNWEISFLYHLLGGFQDSGFRPFLEEKPDYPILGICLGMQEMNVAAGGSLYQDIPFQIYGHTTFESILRSDAQDIHKNYWEKTDNENEYSYIHFHPIKIEKGSFLDYKSIVRNPMVASVHHQSAKKIGKNFKVVATSMDGKVVEALQHTRYKNVYGIQFHTDFSILYDENRTFKTSPTETIEVNKDTKLFHRLFWKNFSGRL